MILTCRDLAKILMQTPDDTPTIDINDGLEGNFVPVLGVSKRETVMGTFITIDADVHRILKP